MTTAEFFEILPLSLIPVWLCKRFENCIGRFSQFQYPGRWNACMMQGNLWRMLDTFMLPLTPDQCTNTPCITVACGTEVTQPLPKLIVAVDTLGGCF